MRATHAKYVAAALAMTVCWAAGSEVDSLADLLVRAHRQNQPIPLLSQRHTGLDVKTAYAVQKAYVQRRLANDRIVGFKLGLTSTAGQKRFGLKAPAAGVLLASGKRTGSPVIDRKAFGKLMIETEIGYVVRERIDRPIADVASLKQKMQAVMPVIELPDLGFADMKALKGVDIIAANVGAAQFVLGRQRQMGALDPNAVAVSLSVNGEEINRGKGSDSLGDQWLAAMRLVNTMIGQGWTIEPGHVLITGAMGKMLPGRDGRYVAEFRDLGQVRFEIR